MADHEFKEPATLEVTDPRITITLDCVTVNGEEFLPKQEDGVVEIDLGNDEKLQVKPIYVSEESLVEGGNTVNFSFDVPDGVEPKRVVCVFAELI